MDKYKNNNFMHGALRTGVSLFLLSGVCAVSAQAQEVVADSTTVGVSGKNKAAARPEGGFRFRI